MTYSYDDAPTQVTKAPPPPPSGQRIGDIQLQAKIAEGLSSEIYQGINTLIGKSCAVKCIRPELEVNAVKKGRYFHRLESAGRLKSSMIATTFGSLTTNDDANIYTIYEWLEGISLRDYLKNEQRLSRRQYLPLIRKLCQTLALAHASNVYHLALHEGNIMIVPGLAQEPSIKILDFGVNELHPLPNEQSAEINRPINCAYYLAPEQAKGLKGDARSDVYALCTLLYRCVTGKYPFEGNSYAEVIERIQHDAPKAPSALTSVTGELETTILRGLEKDPSRRIPSVEALASALDPLSTTTGQHVAVKPTSSVEHRIDTFKDSEDAPLAANDIILKPKKKKLWLFGALGGVFVLCAGILAFILFSSSEKTPAKKSNALKKSRLLKTKRRTSVKRRTLPNRGRRPGLKRRTPKMLKKLPVRGGIKRPPRPFDPKAAKAARRPPIQKK